MQFPPGYISQLYDRFPYEMSSSQSEAVQNLDHYFASAPEGSLFLLKGYAGTGKSSLVGALTQLLLESRCSVVLMAPTGRAAKVLGAYCNASAYTIHRVIYRSRRVDFLAPDFDKDKNLHRPGTIFLVDEASMISNNQDTLSPFGSGQLLEDLLEYIFSVPDCKVLFIGDDAQLPPVGCDRSPALDPDYLRVYCREIHSATLVDIVRQDEESDIVALGSVLRYHILQLQNSGQGAGSDFAPQRLSPIPFVPRNKDVSFLSGEDLPDAVETSIGQVGVEEMVVITRSNKDAEVFNTQLRMRQFGYESPMVKGERVMVARNNYFYYPGSEEQDASKRPTGFTANGEIVTVESIEGSQDLYDFHFMDLLLRSENDKCFLAKVILDTLVSGVASMSAEQRQHLFDKVCEDYPQITRKRDLYKVLRNHPFLNALQLKYAYAMTCHKSQGGQWADVYLYLGYVTEEMMDLDFFRWLYTAVTRATRHLYIINPPKHIFDWERD